jgi:hypothetical protein
MPVTKTSRTYFLRSAFVIRVDRSPQDRESGFFTFADVSKIYLGKSGQFVIVRKFLRPSISVPETLFGVGSRVLYRP